MYVPFVTVIVIFYILLPIEAVRNAKMFANCFNNHLEVRYENEAAKYIKEYNVLESKHCHDLSEASWNYTSNLTNANKAKMIAQQAINANFQKVAHIKLSRFPWKRFRNPQLRRQFKLLLILGRSALDPKKLRELNLCKADMANIYGSSKICLHVKGSKYDHKCNLALEPDLIDIMANSTNYKELLQVWKQWRDTVGPPIKKKYLRYVELSNEAARLNGFRDEGANWRKSYESVTFQRDIENLWRQVKPLYQHLHAYVRRRLIQLFGESKIRCNGPIPAHLLGNMWAQDWSNLIEYLKPFPTKPSFDVTQKMVAKKMTPLDIVKLSEKFFTSLGLKAMTQEFWNKSIFEKPKDREMVCHPSAWDFCNGKDFRIKMCTEVNMDFLVITHHEMGHVQYYMQYANQPPTFRKGANEGFHEAIGDVMALSISTPKHLKTIGLLDNYTEDEENDLNFLMSTALKKVAFLPFGYIVDQWRWKVFSGKISPSQWNTEWWKLRLKYQGVCPPVKRTERDFDPAAKYHIPGDTAYIRYFVSFIIQFQFHQALCDIAGHKGPLHRCDIYNSKEAGKRLAQMLQMGSSRPWPVAMKVLTGKTKMDAGPILKYFEPLLKWLKEKNEDEIIGWQRDDPTICPF
uniref:Angiotensin-converting enzyme n=1 Tax=Hadrurus spadix TaxID=141984 RepID=A0A1W7RA02_9SCOR